jgi:hypothetical protein
MDKMRAGTRYIARGANDRFQVFDSNGFRYAYILVHGANGPVTLTHFAVQEQLYPWQDGVGFTCSDEELNRIFTAGIRGTGYRRARRPAPLQACGRAARTGGPMNDER